MSITVKGIKIEDYDYPLPDDMIARHPLSQRDGCRLLTSCGEEGVRHLHFKDLPTLLPEGGLLVCNNTRVINARLHFRKPTGAQIEVFLLEPHSPTDYNLVFQSRRECEWKCLVGNLKRWKGEELSLALGSTVLKARKGETLPNGAHVVTFCWDNPELTFADVIEEAGRIPIPPYLNRESEESDLEDYQTVYAHIQGSVAAPTAGLHFTPEVFADIEKRGIDRGELTLHVGAGTFQPVKSDVIGEHPMHTEVCSITHQLLEEIIRHKECGKNIIATGTTTVRTLESLPFWGRHPERLHVTQWEAYEEPVEDSLRALKDLKSHMEKLGLEEVTASTAIMIAPGFRWNVVDSMVTNFHQPQSTLLLLVSSFLQRTGKDWREVYEEALKENYRFLSYGDACYFSL